MKKLVIAVSMFILLIVGVLVFAVVNANAIAQRYKPDMERLASDALGNTVTLGAISVSIFPTAKFVVDEVKLESEGETLTLANLTLKVALMPLLQRKLNIQALEIHSPNITMFLDEEGLFIAGLPRKPSSEVSSVEPDRESPASPAPPATSDIPLEISLDNLVLRNATITIKDSVAGAEYQITNLDITAKLSLQDNIATLSKVDGGMTVLTDMDIEFSGNNVAYALAGGAISIERATVEAQGNTFELTGGLDPADAEQSLQLTSQRVDLGSLAPIYDVFAPGLNDMGLKGTAKPNLNLSWQDDGGYLAKGTVAVSGAQATIADITLESIEGLLELEANEQGMSFSTDNMKGMIGESPIGIKVASSIDDKNAALETLTIEAFEGTAGLNTQIQLEGEMPFSSELTIRNMQLEPMIVVILPEAPLNITGQLATVDGKIEGMFSENLMPSISGRIDMALADGLIKEVNLGQEVLGAVKNIPFLSGTLLQAVPESLRAFLEKDHTVLESVTGSFEIANEILTTEDLHVKSDFFALDAVGTIGFDTNLDLDTTIYFSPEFSAGMVNTVGELSVLLDESGRLVFPVKVSGVAPELSVLPDISKLLESAVKGTIKQEAGKLLDEILGSEDEDGEKKGGLLKRLGIRD